MIRLPEWAEGKSPCPPTRNHFLTFDSFTEVYEDAEKKEMRAAQTYKRACNSIRSCPIVFATPRDLISLAGVGPGLVGKLEKKFKDHCQAKGIPVPAGVEGNGAVLRETPSGAAAKKRKDTSGENEPVAQAPPKKTKSTSTAKASKTYIPRPRSGAYAILLALMTSVPDEYQDHSPCLHAISKERNRSCKSGTRIKSIFSGWNWKKQS